jgi:hypothetical protein
MIYPVMVFLALVTKFSNYVVFAETLSIEIVTACCSTRITRTCFAVLLQDCISKESRFTDFTCRSKSVIETELTYSRDTVTCSRIGRIDVSVAFTRLTIVS